MLNLNLNTLSSKLTEQPRGIFTPRFSASFFLYGGGGHGGNAVDPVNPGTGAVGGGGGAGMVVSGSITFVPYLEYTVTVGTGSQSISGSAGFSQMEGWDFNETRPIKAYAGGGQNGNPGDVYRKGGNSGDGYYQTPEGTSSYSAYTGGTGTTQNIAGSIFTAAGGGAGSGQNGVNGVVNQNPAANISGGGGSGSLATIEDYDPSVIAPGPATTYLSSSLGAAGGGTGGGPGQDGSPFGSVGPRGFYGGGAPFNTPFESSGFSYGAGGAGASISATTPAGAGYQGTLIITYCGQPKLDVVNGTTTFDGTNTVHIFNTGSGTFTYANHYLNLPVCGY